MIDYPPSTVAPFFRTLYFTGSVDNTGVTLLIPADPDRVAIIFFPTTQTYYVGTEGNAAAGSGFPIYLNGAEQRILHKDLGVICGAAWYGRSVVAGPIAVRGLSVSYKPLE